MKTKLFLNSLFITFTLVCNGQTMGTMYDEVNGNTYKTMTLGNQTWMDENLKSTKYNDGSPILLVTNDTAWERCEVGKYPAYYILNVPDKDTFILYNWYVVNTGKVCPKGWRVPAVNDYNRLIFHDKFDNDKNYYDSKEYSDSSRIVNHRLTYGFAGNNTNYHFVKNNYDLIKRISALRINWTSWTSTKDNIDRTNSYAYDISHDNKFVYKAIKISEHKNRGCTIRCIKD